MSSIGGRLTQYIESKGISKGELSEKTELHYNYLVRMLKDKKGLSSQTLDRIFTAFPELNARWLITGVGAMEYSSMGNNVKEVGNTYENNFENRLLDALEKERVQGKIRDIIKKDE